MIIQYMHATLDYAGCKDIIILLVILLQTMGAQKPQYQMPNQSWHVDKQEPDFQLKGTMPINTPKKHTHMWKQLGNFKPSQIGY